MQSIYHFIIIEPPRDPIGQSDDFEQVCGGGGVLITALGVCLSRSPRG